MTLLLQLRPPPPTIIVSISPGITFSVPHTSDLDYVDNAGHGGAMGIAGNDGLIIIKSLYASSSDTTVSCDSYTWHGTYTVSGDYTDAGSGATLHLTINHSSSYDTAVTTRDRYKWHGVTYTHDGVYTYHTTNAAGCDSTVRLHLTLTHCSGTSSFTKTDAGCYSFAMGTVTLTPVGGTPPFTYRLSTSGSITAPSGSFSNLKAGTYRGYVKDANGCIAVSAPIVINQFAKVTATLTATPAVCYGSATGKITISNPVGTPPFQYKLSSSTSYMPFTAPFDITGLKAGKYVVQIQDANGCIGSAGAITVTQPTPITSIFTKIDETCHGAKDGSITVTASGGTPPYQYKNGTNGTWQNSGAFTGLKAGSYRIYMQDNVGCSKITAPIKIDSSSVECTHLADSLVAYYPLNNDFQDYSGKGNHGTLNGNSGNFVPDRNGISNGAYYFDGSTWADCGNNPSLNHFENGMSTSYWINYKLPFQFFYNRAFGKQDNSSLVGWAIAVDGGINPDSTQAAYLNMELTNSQVGPSHFGLDSVWYHVLVTADPVANKVKMYFNGILDTVISPQTPMRLNSSANLTLGAYYAFGLAYYKGLLDDIKIWNRVLNDQEAAALYSSNSNKSLSSPLLNKTEMVLAQKTLGNKSIKTENLSDREFKLFPNPATNILNIYNAGFRENKQVTISVISSSGVVVKTIQKISSTLIPLDVSAFGKGVYTLKIISSDKVFYKQFIKL